MKFLLFVSKVVDHHSNIARTYGGHILLLGPGGPLMLQTMLVVWQEEMHDPALHVLGPGLSLGEMIFLQPLPSASAFATKLCTTHLEQELCSPDPSCL